jgi:hypothetical protein
MERISRNTSKQTQSGECSTTEQALASCTIRLSFDGERQDLPRLGQRR